MNTKFKGLIKKIYLDGVKNHKLSLDLQEKEIKKWYRVLELYQIETKVELLEEFILEDKNIPDFCIKYQLDTAKVNHKLKSAMNILLKDKYTSDVLSGINPGIINLQSFKMFWLRAIEIYKEKYFKS